MGWPGPLTDRQYWVWQAWLDDAMNHPGSIEFYLMAVATEVRRGYVKEPAKVSLSDMRLQFRRQAAGKPAADGKTAAAATPGSIAQSQLRWMAAVTQGQAKVRILKPDGTLEEMT